MRMPSFLALMLLTTSLHAKPCKDLLARMLELYPDQNTKMMLTRLQNAKNKHMFMRAFIPIYYQESFAIRETIPVYKKLGKHTGQIVGDAHVGNFGVLLDNKGKPVLTLVDYDDVGQAPLFLDVVRLSQSASYMGDFKQAKFLEAYKKGLTNSDHKLSSYVTKLQDKSQQRGMATKADYASTPQGPRFSSKTEPATAVTAAEQKSLEKVLQGKFGKKVKLHDSYKTMKESGGSAYGNRYHALVEIDGNMNFIEFKEIMDGGVVAWGKQPATNADRIESAMSTYLGKGFENNLDVVEVAGTPYQLRFKAEGNKAFDVGRLSGKDMEKAIQDEFFILGQLHRRSLGNTNASVSSYASDLEQVSTKDWEDSVKVMKKVVKTAYEKGNQ